MKIGILGAGNIGKQLSNKLAVAGHDVKVAHFTKAWNTIFMMSLAERGRPKGDPERIAGPVSGDRARDREIAIALMDDTGFDGFDAGPLADSWRQQPSSPVYCTDLTYEEVGPALAVAERERLPKRRELTAAVFAERRDQWTAESVARIHRALNM